MTERERAHPPSLPTSPTETSPPKDPPLSPNGDLPSIEELNDHKVSEGLDPEGQETVASDSANDGEISSKVENLEEATRKVCMTIFHQ